MKETLNQLLKHQSLSFEQAKKILINIGKGLYNQSQLAAFITAYQMRNITVKELSGFSEALLELRMPVNLSEFSPIDLCGTGGDGKNTFNISTLASFVVAGAEIKVAKHGNYGVSSGCGSSNLMEHLGYKFTNDENILKKQIDKAGICFLHAPLFHPAMKHIAPVRKELGIKTLFNMLGPMVNPCKPNKQIVGVYSVEIARLYNYVFQNSSNDYFIIHSLDGYDEISLTDDFMLISKQQEQVMSPEDLGMQKIKAHEIFGGENTDESAKIFIRVLKNEATNAQKNVVVANAAMAIKCAHTNYSISESIDKAKESLESGKAYESLKKLLNA